MSFIFGLAEEVELPAYCPLDVFPQRGLVGERPLFFFLVVRLRMFKGALPVSGFPS